jgi:hypothetical protein
MNGFKREEYSNNQWQSSKDVVLLSLQNIKSRHALFVPGDENRALLKSIRKTSLKRYLDLKIL